MGLPPSHNRPSAHNAGSEAGDPNDETRSMREGLGSTPGTPYEMGTPAAEDYDETRSVVGTEVGEEGEENLEQMLDG